MNIRKLALSASLCTLALTSLAPTQASAAAKDQYFPVLVYRTGAYAANGAPWAGRWTAAAT